MEKVKNMYNYETDITAILDEQKDIGTIPDDLFAIQEDSKFFDRFDHVDVTSSNAHSISSDTFWKK